MAKQKRSAAAQKRHEENRAAWEKKQEQERVDAIERARLVSMTREMVEAGEVKDWTPPVVKVGVLKPAANPSVFAKIAGKK